MTTRHIAVCLALWLAPVACRTAFALESYSSHTIITADWGKEYGQIGLVSDASIDGPSGSTRTAVALDVTPTGDIYILDTPNWRVAIYGPDGKYKSSIDLEKDPPEFRGPLGFRGGMDSPEFPGDYIVVADDGNIYVDTGGRRPYLVRCFTPKGELARVYIGEYLDMKGWGYTKTIPEEIKKRVADYNAYFDRLKLAGKLNIVGSAGLQGVLPSRFFPLGGNLEGMGRGLVPSDYSVKRIPGMRVFIHVDGTQVTLPEKLRSLVTSSDAYDQSPLLFVTKDLDLIKSFPEKGLFKREDAKGNVHFGGYDHMTKYSPAGKLLAEIPINPPPDDGSPDAYVSSNGDFYQIIRHKPDMTRGFSVIKWSRKP